MSTHILVIIGLREETETPFGYLFNIGGKEEYLRFIRVPFGVQSSPFMLGTTLQHHLNKQPENYKNTVDALKEKTYAD